MPVSLCEWRVRIGRFVHQAREYVIRERKEKLLMERIRRLKLLHKRLLEKGDKSEHECESDQNELSAKVDNAPNKSSIINNDTPIDSHKEDSCSGSESTTEENTTNYKSNGDDSAFPFFFTLLLALFSSIFFFVVDFSNLLESSKPLLNLGGESTWRSTCLRIIVCSSLVYILLSSIINTKEDVQDNLVLIGNENTIIKTNKTSTESTNNENNTATGTTIKSDISSTESNVEENNTQTESAIGKNYTLTDSRIREKNTTTESTKDNIPMNATITKTNTPSTTRDWPSESKQSKTQTSKRKNIKEKNTMTELTTRENSTLPESTTKDDIAQKECHIDTPSTMTDKPSKRKTSKRKTLKGKKTPTESIIKDNNTPNVSTMKDNNTNTESTIKDSNTPSTVKDKSSKRNISRRNPTKDKNIATASHIKENTTTTGSTIKEKSSSTESAIKYNGISTESTIKDKNTTTKSTIKHNNSVTESTMKESSTLSTIKDKVLKRKNSKRKITKYKNTATKSKIKGNTTTNESTIKDNSLTESTIKDNNSTSEATIKENTTTTKSTIKEYNSSTKSTIKGSNTPTKFAIKDDNSPTESTVKKNHSTARSVNKGSNSTAERTIKENNSSSECTIKEKNTQTESTIKVDNTTAERTINCNDTTTESTITDRNSTTESTINDYNPSSVSTIKDTKTPIEPTTTDYNARIELSIKDNTSTNQCSIKEKNIPTESPIKGNNSTSESAIKDRNTTNKSAIKENNTSSRTPTEENNNQSMKVNIAQAEVTIRSGIQKVLSDGKHGISSRIPSSLKGTTDNPVMQESTCLPEMILVKAGDVEQNPGPFDRSTQIQEQELVNLAYDVPSSKYTELCMALGVSYNQSQTILDRHLLDCTRSLNAVFFKWKDRQMDGTDCRQVIAAALSDVDLDSLGDNISRGSYLQQEAAPTASIANEKKPLTTKQVTRCGDDFKTFYRTQLFKIKTDPLNFSLVFEFERIYTDLVLLRYEQGTTKKIPLDYNILLKTEVNGELPKRLMVEGEGGAGKTTFCSKMAWDWTNGADNFQEFVWVLVIHLRDIDRNQTVGDIARTYLSDSNSVQPHQIDEYILANPSKVLIILDGLDEYDDDLVKQGSDIAKIIRSEKFKECRVLVTTRPWKADQIKSNANFMKIYAFIAVAGFDKRHISIYINKYFDDDSQASRDLVKLIEENDLIQENMAPFPIYIAMLCILWRDSDSKKRELIRRLKTFSQLFQEIIISLKDHYVSKQVTDLDIETVTQYYEQLDFCFSQIGKMALSGIMKKKLVYGKDDFSSCEGAMETCCRVGVLSRETRLVRRQDRHKKPTNLVRESIFFPHKLFQEYLAGMYLASLFESQYEQYKRAISDVIRRAKEFRYLLYFTASQSKNVGIDVIDRLINKVIRDNDFLVDIAFEAYDEDAAKMVRQRPFAKQKSVIINDKMSAHTVSGYIFIMEKIQMETLIVTTRSCGPTVSRDLADVISSSTELKALELRGATFHDDFYGILESKVNTSKIEKVCIDGCNLHVHGNDPTASRDLAKFLCLLPCLTDLTIKDSDSKFQHIYFHDDFYHEIARLASSSKIEKVCIYRLDLHDNDPTALRDLAKCLCLLPCLIDLKIQHIYFHDDFCHELACLASSSKIEEVCIDGCNLHVHGNDPTASRDLAKFLCLLPCLTDLTINQITFHDNFCNTIARLASSSKIEKVCIDGCDLRRNDPTASRDLAKFMCLLPCLTDLTIKNYDIHFGHTYFHDDFYHEIAHLASSSKIEKVCIWVCDLEGNDRTASRDLAKFLCLLPRLTDLTIKDPNDTFEHIRFHDDFYHEIALLASYSQIEKVCIEGFNLHRNDPTASRDLAKLLCLLPRLTDLTIKNSDREFTFGYFHDDFYHEIASLASSSKIQKVCINGLDLYENDPTASRDLAKFLCLLPCLTDLTMKDSDDRYKRHSLHDDVYHELARLTSSSKNPFFTTNITWTTWYNEHRSRSVLHVPLAPSQTGNLPGRLPSEQPDNQHGTLKHEDINRLYESVVSLESSVTQQSIGSHNPGPVQIHGYIDGEQYTLQAPLQSSHEHRQSLAHCRCCCLI